MTTTTQHKLETFRRTLRHAEITIVAIPDTTVNVRLMENWQACQRTAKRAVADYEARIESERLQATAEAIWGQPQVTMGHLASEQKKAPILALVDFPDDDYHNDIADCAHQICATYNWEAVDSPDNWIYTGHSHTGATYLRCDKTDESIIVYSTRYQKPVRPVAGF